MKTVATETISQVRERVWSNDQQRRNSLFGFLLFSPALLLMVTLFLLPVIYILWLSFHEMSILATEGEFVGVQNYVELFTSREFYQSLWIGALYAVGSTAFQLAVGLALALLANKTFFGSSAVRTLVIFPYLVPMIAVVIMWQWIANPVYGVLNHYLVTFGIVNESISFFGSLNLALPSVIVASSWKFTAFVSLILLARLQAIDDTLYEQAKICGASSYQMFREITLPNLWSAILLVVFLRLIFMFNKFSSIWLFTEGGPLSATTNLPIHVYQTTFQEFELGSGSATAIAFFGIMIAFAMLYFSVFNPSEEIETT